MGLARFMAAGLIAAALGSGTASAQGSKDVKFVLDWALQGNHSIWALALDRGIFADKGLRVTMDRGFGSGDTVTKIATGTYDIGFADLNAAIKFTGDNPDSPIISVYQVFDVTLNAITALKKSGIKTPKELEGKNLGSPEGDSSRVMFPAFARANDIDQAKISWTTMAPNLRETMLVQGQVDAISGFSATTFFNLAKIGVKPEDMTMFPYADHGLDVYGSAIIVRKDYAEKNPDVVKAFVEATIEGTRQAIADRDAAMAALKKVDPLADTALERERLQFYLDRAMLTERIKKEGFGSVDPERMKRSIEVAAEAYQLKEPPAPENVYSTAYLPPKEQRMP